MNNEAPLHLLRSLAILITAHFFGMLFAGCGGGSDPGDTCHACREAMLGAKQLLPGKSECSHGPDDPGNAANVQNCMAYAAQIGQPVTDPSQLINIDPAVLCVEMNGGNGNCKCFDCGGAGCEGFIESASAWCGLGRFANGRVCNYKMVPIAATDIFRREGNASLPGNGVCSGKAGMISPEVCGNSATNGDIYNFGCVANVNCVVGPITEYTAGDFGVTQRLGCAPTY